MGRTRRSPHAPFMKVDGFLLGWAPHFFRERFLLFLLFFLFSRGRKKYRHFESHGVCTGPRARFALHRFQKTHGKKLCEKKYQLLFSHNFKMATAQCNGDCSRQPPTLTQPNAELIVKFHVAKLIVEGRLRCVDTFIHDHSASLLMRCYVLMNKDQVKLWIYNFTH